MGISQQNRNHIEKYPTAYRVAFEKGVQMVRNIIMPESHFSRQILIKLAGQLTLGQNGITLFL